jgi:hypothetical protein
MTREETNFQAFGQELRKARESLGRSLDDIAATTRINRRHIESIEAGDLGALPTGPYVQAFLKEYARNVGLKLPSDLSVAGTSTSGGAVKSVTPASGRGAATVGPRASTTKPGIGSSAFELPSAAIKATKDTARFANQAAKSVARTAAKTTENVFKKVETGAKDAVDVFTSKSLRDEAEQVRRERLGLEPLPFRYAMARPNLISRRYARRYDLRSKRLQVRSSQLPLSPLHPDAVRWKPPSPISTMMIKMNYRNPDQSAEGLRAFYLRQIL